MREQLSPIQTLSALTDSFAREGLHIASAGAAAPEPASGPFSRSPLEVAYVTRWIELVVGCELGGWRFLCQGARR